MEKKGWDVWVDRGECFSDEDLDEPEMVEDGTFDQVVDQAIEELLIEYDESLILRSRMSGNFFRVEIITKPTMGSVKPISVHELKEE